MMNTALSRALRPLERLVDALGDPAGAHRAAAGAIAVYGVLWWAYALVAKSTQDVHFDTTEAFAWSLDLAWGYPKHPPLSAWVLAAWFAIFPTADWSAYLLSVAIICVALWFVWLIAERYVAGDKRALALAFLALTPAFNFQPLKFNSNALMIPVWAMASYFFLRSYLERSLFWGVLAGVGAALAMLTKYWSIFLLIGFAAAVLSDPRRWAYVRSPAPWASVAAGTILIVPNIVSLLVYNFEPFHYAATEHGVTSLRAVLESAVNYLGGVLFLAGGFVAVALAARPDAATWRDMLWSKEPDRRLMAAAIAAMLVVPPAFAVAFEVRLDSLWTIPYWAMLPALLMSAPTLAVTRRAAAGVLAAALAVPVVALIASPFVAITILHKDLDNAQAYHSVVAREVDRLWPQVSKELLRYVIGRQALAWGCTFYCRDHPRAVPSWTFAMVPWIDPDAVKREGFVVICQAGDQPCLGWAKEFSRDSTVREQSVEVARSFLGYRGEPRRFTLILAQPRR